MGGKPCAEHEKVLALIDVVPRRVQQSVGNVIQAVFNRPTEPPTVDEHVEECRHHHNLCIHRVIGPPGVAHQLPVEEVLPDVQPPQPLAVPANQVYQLLSAPKGRAARQHRLLQDVEVEGGDAGALNALRAPRIAVRAAANPSARHMASISSVGQDPWQQRVGGIAVLVW
eukprot:CAMPEP_0177590014 /NCGR_PEP_ID=MMETSP0419_2-20121207/7147_1 /TAXON_ID=582737 /ORGANISM="Tetraselmis sp., Strain GSL018" /LENGTH=169 /DNA_ID=CAMNT_0019080479 /DNA_START=966 /DNA_END=1472 /DNA_ORIENTATION=-